MMSFLRIFSLLAFLSFAAPLSFAQDVPALEEQPPVAAEAENLPEPVVIEPQPEAVDANGGEQPVADISQPNLRNMSLKEAYPQMSSLFFSRWEHDLIINARLGLNVRPPEAPIEDLSSPASIHAGEMGPREIALGGIVYNSRDNWTIWLNGMRVTPTALPEQIMDINVYKEYVEIEWLDTSTNQIYPVRLRPHQRFNLDTRIFLPG